jgi:Fe-S cluster assembly protein SufB
VTKLTYETPKGLNEEIILKISQIKQEPKWMTDFRVKSYYAFINSPMPDFGPYLDIDFGRLTYYKRIDDKVHADWDEVPNKVRKTFADIGIQKAEKEYLGGVSTQYESEVIYHNMLSYLDKKGVIFVDTDTALKKYPKLFRKYFSQLVKYDENKFTSLNGCVWSGGTFIYVPPGVKLDRPLQSYFRINTKDMGQFERTIIVVDDDAELDYIEGCTAPTYTTDSLHAAVVEIYVGKNARCRYTTIQNWASNIYNLVTKRAIVEENGLMEWIDGNIGSKVNMKYPAVILKGKGARGNCVTISVADQNQIQDTGAKMIHLAPYTKSNIMAKSIARNGGNASYRGLVKITEAATNSYSSVKCDTVILDEQSKSDAIPTNILANQSSVLEHEATVSKISQEQLFYLMSRGLTMEQATELIILGFIDVFRKELPMEYAVELNKLLQKKEYCL